MNNGEPANIGWLPRLLNSSSCCSFCRHMTALLSPGCRRWAFEIQTWRFSTLPASPRPHRMAWLNDAAPIRSNQNDHQSHTFFWCLYRFMCPSVQIWLNMNKQHLQRCSYCHTASWLNWSCVEAEVTPTPTLFSAYASSCWGPFCTLWSLKHFDHI